MFRWNVLDALSRTHFVIVPVLYVPAVVALVAYSVLKQGLSVALAALLVAAGVLAWTLVEYVLHRFAFHRRVRSRFGRRLHFLVHGVHHEWPGDRYRLVMPPAVSLSLFLACLWCFSAVLGRLGCAFHAGFTLGYVAYDLTHYYLHHGTPAVGGVLERRFRRLRKHHMLHHFKSSESRFGVSSELWDYVFSTRGRGR